MQNKLWFKAKRWGWGWRPVSWQGWVLLIIYVLGLISYFIEANKEHSTSDFLIKFGFKFIPLTILLVVICYLKGEAPHWHWGK